MFRIDFNILLMNKLNTLLFLLFFSSIHIVFSQDDVYTVVELNEDFDDGNFKNIFNHNKYIKDNIIPNVKYVQELVVVLDNVYKANEALGKNQEALEFAEIILDLGGNLLHVNSSIYEVGLYYCVFQSMIIGDDKKILHYSNLGINHLDSNYLTNIDSYILFLEQAALIQFSNGDISNAKENYLKLNLIYGKQLPDKNEEYFLTKIMLGSCYFVSEQYVKAELYFHESIAYLKEHYGEKNDLYITSINGLFGSYVMTNKIQEASKIKNECFNLSEKYLGKTSKEYSNLLTVGAVYYNVIGELSNKSSNSDTLKLSLDYFNKSIELASERIKILSNQTVFAKEIEELNGNIALSYYFLKQYHKGLKFAELSNNPAVQTFYYLNLNQNSKADSVFMTYIKSRNETFDKLNASLGNDDQLLLKSRQFIYSNIGLMNYTKLRGYENQSLIDFCFSNWLTFNGSINNQYNDLRKLIGSSGDSHVFQKYSEFKSLKIELADLYQSAPDPSKNKRIKFVEDSLMLIEQQLNEFYSLNKSNVVYSEIDIKNSLKDDEVFVEIVKVPTFDFIKGKVIDSINYYVFIVQKEKNIPLKQIFIENGNDLEGKLLKEYSKSTVGKNIEYRDIDKTSYNAFWKPIADKIKDKKKIYVSMGGVYNNINIQTLYNPETSNYLFEEKDIQIVNSGRSFVQGRTKSAPTYSNNSATLIGFPNYNDSLTAMAFSDMIGYSRDLNPSTIDSLTRGGFSLSNLPGTKTEVEAIEKSLSSNKWNVDLLTANQATETTLKKSNSPRVLHIATHGYFMSDLEIEKDVDTRLLGMERKNVIENPLLRSGLFFAGANQTLKGEVIDNGDNGILTALEASFLNLQETELVVLSACETGRGEVKNGEGVYGLRKAFTDAGAQNIIMSLWKVDDKVTQEFMTTFYSNWLVDKSTIRVAFNKTQLEIKAKYPQPYYWGAFILVGE